LSLINLGNEFKIFIMKKKGITFLSLMFIMVVVGRTQTSIIDVLEDKVMIYRESMFGFMSPTITPAYTFSRVDYGNSSALEISDIRSILKLDMARFGYIIKVNAIELDRHKSLSINFNPRLDFNIAYEGNTELRIGTPISIAFNNGVAATNRALLGRGWAVEVGIEFSNVVLPKFFAPSGMYYLNSYFYNNNKVPVEAGEAISIMTDVDSDYVRNGILVRRRTVYPFINYVYKSFGKGWLFRKSTNRGALDLYFSLGYGAGLDFRNDQGVVNTINQTSFRVGLRKNFRYM